MRLAGCHLMPKSAMQDLSGFRWSRVGWDRLGWARFVWAILAGAVLGSGMLGCGEAVEGQKVVGRITYRGEPLTYGLINFVQSGQRPVGGPVATDGSYECFLAAGRYQVRIDAPPQLPEGWKEGDPMPQGLTRALPANYADFRTSGLTVEVGTSGEELVHDIALP